jgi:DNA-binding LytR/AlgR family response regulator
MMVFYEARFMKVGLICSENMNRVILQIMDSRNISLDNRADVVLVEKGLSLPEGRLSVVFDHSTLDQMIDFLDAFSVRGDAESTKRVIAGKSDNKYELIKYEQILYFEGSGNSTMCITYGGRYKVKEKLYELEQNLYDQGFVRVGKPYIVNILNVAEIIPWFGGRLLLKLKNTDGEIEVARSYARSFKEYLGM